MTQLLDGYWATVFPWLGIGVVVAFAGVSLAFWLYGGDR